MKQPYSSLLTPPRPIGSVEEFEVGRHGIMMESGGRRAVFLPQVATEQGWDRDELLAQLSLKAGLPADAWRHDAELSVFAAEVFGETDPPVR